MAFKLLNNVIASGTQVQHMAGEIVDIADQATAQSLVARGLAKPVHAPATHVWAESNGTEARGGKTVAQKQAEAAAPEAGMTPEQPAAPTAPATPDGFPARPATPAPQAPAQPKQPTPEEVAAAAASVN